MGSDVALYLRISVDRSGRKESVAAQEKWGRAYAAKAWPGVPIRVFADNNISAAGDDERPEFERFRAAVRAGEIGHVWTVEQSRLTRRVDGDTSWFEIAVELHRAGIAELHTRRDGLIRVRDVAGKIKAVINADEVDRLKDRLRDKQDAAAAEGRPAGAVVFGYRHGLDEGGGKTLHVIPEQAAVIREIADRVLAGWSLSNITRALDERGVKGAHAGVVKRDPDTGEIIRTIKGTLTATGVKKIVTNATVAGLRVHRGEVVRPGVWAPILDEATWRAVRLKLSQPRTVTCPDGGSHEIGAAALTSRTGRKYVLTSGLSVCGVCWSPLVGTLKQYRSGSRKISRPYLLCSPTRGGRGCVGIMLDEVEQHVADRLFDELDRPEFLAALDVDVHAERRDAVLADLKGIDAQRAELATMWARRDLTMAEWTTARESLTKQENELRSELAAVPPPVIEVDIAGAREAYPLMTLDEQREFVRLFVARVVIHRARPGTKAFDRERVTVEWRER